jgi:CRP-like cAMP-binding protein
MIRRHHRPDGPAGNWLLDALPDADYDRLRPHLREMPLARGRVLFESGEPVRNIYFPTRGLLSLVLMARDGNEVEVAAVGPEGALDVAAVLRCDKTMCRAVVQIAGAAYWLSATTLQKELHSGGAMQALLNCYLQFLLLQSFQTTLCNRLHNVEARLARWLLTTSDRAQLDQLPLTQEFISHMLGTRRASVTEACATLAQEGLIEHVRGCITILDGRGLEAKACECYAAICNELQIVYGQRHPLSEE